jgi:hypothetical protein
VNSPIDADAVLRDDALLDALGRGELPADFAGDPTARLLFAWQGDLHEPAPALPLARSTALWLSRRVTVAAAIGVFAAGSLGSVAAAAIAEPGDALWPITKVVYTERAESIEARDEAYLTLRQARVAIAEHRPDQARRLCDEARRKAGEVRENDDRAAITDELAKVLATLDHKARAGAPVAPEAPKDPTPETPSSSPTTEPSPRPQPSPETSTQPVPDVPPSPTALASPDAAVTTPLSSPGPDTP